MSRFSPSLRMRLIGLVLLAVAPAIFLSTYTGFRDRDDARERAQADALRVADLAAKEQQDQISGAHAALLAVSRLPVVTDPALTGCNQFMSAVLGSADSLSSFSVADSTGTIVCSSNEAALGRAVGGSSWFSRAIRDGDFTTGGYTFSSAGLPLFVAAQPFLDSDGATRMLITSVPFSWLESIFTAYNLPPGGTLTIVDASGTIMGHYPDNDAWVGKSPQEKIANIVIKAKARGTVESRGIDNIERLYGYTTMPFSEPGRDAYVFAGYPTSVAYAHTNEIQYFTFAGLALTLALVLCVAWYGRDLFVLQHIKTLAATAKRLGDGDLSARSGVPYSGEEVGQLAKTLDEMAASLEEARRERTRFETALSETAKDLSRRNDDLEAFTYSVSHDLKEPLRAIEGFSQYLASHYSDEIDERGKDLLGRIANASVRMKHLIDDLLALSRAGRIADSDDLVNTRRIVDEIIESIRPLLDERNAVVEVSDLPRIAADHSRIDQIFRNLIGNGIKYNRRLRPVIQVGVEKIEDGKATFYVRDNGIGIAPQYHEKIFGLFQRLHTRDEFEGNGAGLAIVKRAVEALGGEIWLQSADDVGTTFFLTLPVAVEAESSREPRVAA